jgi:hypothetical protein
MKQFSTLKSLAIIAIVAISFTSCSQKDVVAPVTAKNNNTQTTPVSYTDQNIGISNFQASQVSASELNIDFSVLFANNVAKIEVLSGETASQLCTIYTVDVTGNTSTAKSFSVDDTNIKGSTMNYMIKFTLTNGDWGYTPVYSLQVKQ